MPNTNVTTIEYRGHRIQVSHVGKGWRASIFSPGSIRALADSPSNLEKSRKEEIFSEAKRIVICGSADFGALRRSDAGYEQQSCKRPGEPDEYQ